MGKQESIELEINPFVTLRKGIPFSAPVRKSELTLRIRAWEGKAKIDMVEVVRKGH